MSTDEEAAFALELVHQLALAQPTLGEVDSRIAERHRRTSAQRARQRVSSTGPAAERLRAAVMREVESDRIHATRWLVEVYRERRRQGAKVPVELHDFLVGAGFNVITAAAPEQALKRLLGLGANDPARRPGLKRTEGQDARELRIAAAVEAQRGHGPKNGGLSLEVACEAVAAAEKISPVTVKKIYNARGREARLSQAKL